MSTSTATYDISKDDVIDYCQHRVGDGLYAAYCYSEDHVEQNYIDTHVEEAQEHRFGDLVDELHAYHQRLSETRVESQKSTLHLHDGYCVVQLMFTTTEGLILFFDDSLASNHSNFVDKCFEKAR